MNGLSCVVTGAAGGIGGGIVEDLLSAGWSVIGLDINEPANIQNRRNFQSVIGDVADAESHRAAAELAATAGNLVGWVNCAGYNILGSVADIEPAALTRGVEVNLLGVFHGTGEAVRRFMATDLDHRRGAIVNISSIQASVGFPGFAAYAMTKGGIESLSRQVAAEYVAQGIRCNVVAPGLVQSPMNDQLLASDPVAAERIARWRQITPMGRWAKPIDIAHAVTFLLSEDSSYITGETLAVNGGALALAPGQGAL